MSGVLPQASTLPLTTIHCKSCYDTQEIVLCKQAIRALSCCYQKLSTGQQKSHCLLNYCVACRADTPASQPSLSLVQQVSHPESAHAKLAIPWALSVLDICCTRDDYAQKHSKVNIRVPAHAQGQLPARATDGHYPWSIVKTSA